MAAVIIFILLLVNYALGISMIELWQISVALLAVSFGAWFEVHSKYSEDVKEKKKKRLTKVRDEISKICEMLHEEKNESEMEQELVHLTTLYELSNEPINLFEQTWNAFSVAGLFFLVSVFCRLGVDLLLLLQLSAVEAFTFLLGIFFFIFAIMSTRNLMNLLSSDKDPLISMLRIGVIAVIQALHSYLIWQLSLTLGFVTSTIYFLVFYILLWFTFVGAILFWKGTEDKDRKTIFGGFIALYSPWIWLAIVGVLLRLGLIR